MYNESLYIKFLCHFFVTRGKGIHAHKVLPCVRVFRSSTLPIRVSKLLQKHEIPYTENIPHASVAQSN